MRIVSGIQPTGNLHLGNYLGAIRNWVAMQDALRPGEQALFFLADMHAITMRQEPAELRRSTLEMAAALMASGIDPEKSVLFHQSAVPEHAELCWILGCTARIGWLNRMTQFKEKSGKDREGASVGLYSYPVLQAADVLLYKATHVPVGEDQRQHLELARDTATKFNNDYGVALFPLPEAILPKATMRVKSLRDGAAKMSKSDPSDQSRINLTDDADAIRAKIRRAKTDSAPLPTDVAGLEGRPEARNLVEIYATFAEKPVADVLRELGGQGFGALKPALADLVAGKLQPINARYRELLGNPAAIRTALLDGAAQASKLAAATMREVRDAVGFL